MSSDSASSDAAASQSNDDGERVARRLASLRDENVRELLGGRANADSETMAAQAARVSVDPEQMEDGKLSIEREGDRNSLVHFATGQAVIEDVVERSGVKQAFLTDKAIASAEQQVENDVSGVRCVL